jgi:hypothetical protein
MSVRVDVEAGEGASEIDRTHSGSFTVCIGGAEIRFENEGDAVFLARRILTRMGETDLKAQVDALTDQERKELFGKYCVHCGCKDPSCPCQRDE